MYNRKIPRPRGHHNQSLSNKASHRSLSRSRKSHRSCASAHDPRELWRSFIIIQSLFIWIEQTSLLNSNDNTQRRASSASSPRSHLQPDDRISRLLLLYLLLIFWDLKLFITKDYFQYQPKNNQYLPMISLIKP